MSSTDVIATGGKRACKVCRAPRDLVVRAQRTDAKKSGVRFAGYCATCGNYVGAIATSKVSLEDQVLLELALDEADPEQRPMFAGAQLPRGTGDGA